MASTCAANSRSTVGAYQSASTVARVAVDLAGVATICQVTRTTTALGDDEQHVGIKSPHYRGSCAPGPSVADSLARIRTTDTHGERRSWRGTETGARCHSRERLSGRDRHLNFDVCTVSAAAITDAITTACGLNDYLNNALRQVPCIGSASLEAKVSADMGVREAPAPTGRQARLTRRGRSQACLARQVGMEWAPTPNDDFTRILGQPPHLPG